jgi:DnaJ family protein C protein 17
LNQAYELLLDPLRRLALDAKLRVKQARAERFKSYDNKRKDLVEELEERERAFKKARTDKQKEEVETWRETERIKEQGKLMREQKEKELQQMMKGKQEEKEVAKEREEAEEAPPAMSALFFAKCFLFNSHSIVDPLDTTIRLKYPLKAYPNLTTPAAVSAFLSRFGATDESSIVLSLSLKNKTPSKPDKPPKTGSALVPFKQIGDAFAAVCASGRKEMGMDVVKITWVSGKEPAILGWLRKMGKLGGIGPGTGTHKQPVSASSMGVGIKAELPQNQTRDSSSAPFSSFPSSFVSFSRFSLRTVLSLLTNYEIIARYIPNAGSTPKTCCPRYRLRVSYPHAHATS